MPIEFVLIPAAADVETVEMPSELVLMPAAADVETVEIPNELLEILLMFAAIDD